MHCQSAEAVQDRQAAAELERVAVCSAVDYPLQADRLRQNFRQSRRMPP